MLLYTLITSASLSSDTWKLTDGRIPETLILTRMKVLSSTMVVIVPLITLLTQMQQCYENELLLPYSWHPNLLEFKV